MNSWAILKIISIFIIYTFLYNSSVLSNEKGIVYSNVKISEISKTSATISWTTNNPTQGFINYGPTTIYEFQSVAESTYSNNHKINLDNLYPNTNYQFRITSKSKSGKMAVSSNYSLTTLSSNDESETVWKIPTTNQEWRIEYDGYGFIDFDPINGIVMEPLSAKSADMTHATLVLSKRTEIKPLSDFKIIVKVATEEQTRKENSNPWEVFWLFFNYTLDSQGKKETNYFIFKPNGIELGWAQNELTQHFLWTSSNPQLEIGKIYTLQINKKGQIVEAYIDGQLVMSYRGSEFPNILLNKPGAIGLYSEDARVRIYSVEIFPL